MSQAPFRIHLIGNWSRSQIQINYQPTEYALPGDFARRAMVFWEKLTATGSQHLFNGALCRLEKFSEKNGVLHLSLSRTCYRDLLFSNAHTDELVNILGEVGPVRALGISVVIETTDAYVALIRRSEHVGEGPGALDVIGGHVHPDDHCQNGAPDVFWAIKDEIRSELGILMNSLDDPVCCGLTEDRSHHKPELDFFAPLPLTMHEVQQLARHAPEADEYTELLAVKAEADVLQRFIAEHETDLTSSALGCLHLYMRMKNWPAPLAAQ